MTANFQIKLNHHLEKYNTFKQTHKEVEDFISFVTTE